MLSSLDLRMIIDRGLAEEVEQDVFLELNGNFSNLTSQLVFPGTTTPIPGNIIPASLITPDGRAVANVYRQMESLATSFS